MRAVIAAVLLLTSTLAAAQAGPATDLRLNEAAVLQTSADPVQKGVGPKKLWARWLAGEALSSPQVFAKVYAIDVQPGQRYTLYAWFKPDGVYRNLYVAGDNPLTDVDYSFGKSGNRGWVELAQQPSKESCNEVTRRENFTVAPDSTSTRLYLIVVSRTPGQTVRAQLRTPADGDADVNGNTQDPACAARKGNTWGRLWSSPLILQLDPSESAAPKPAATSTRRTDEAPSLPLNQKLRLDTPAEAVQQASTPKKLWTRWVKGEAAGGPLFVSVHSFVLEPGASYTLYVWFRPDGVYRNLYVTGDNPLTDVEATFGKSGNRGWVVVNQQPAKEACEERTYRENFSISPESTSRRFYLIVTSKTPAQAIHVLMKSPADSDEDVTRNTSDPACPARKGNTWGRRWSSPVLLQLDPSETGNR